MQLHFLRDEALELRQAKEAAVVEKEQLTIRLERRNQQLQVWARTCGSAHMLCSHQNLMWRLCGTLASVWQ